MTTLGQVNTGEQCEIIEVRHCGGCGGACHDNGHGHAHGSKITRAEEMGLKVGKLVKMLRNDGNLLLLLVDNARIAIDRPMAMKIMVC
ncbi:MAG: FeoA family protein [Geobacteraceae bacterium GWC2_48_7]|nr:MAG: FeoA family protein [Geobacteraceae bacterium GWC2_48_7]